MPGEVTDCTGENDGFIGAKCDLTIDPEKVTSESTALMSHECALLGDSPAVRSPRGAVLTSQNSSSSLM